MLFLSVKFLYERNCKILSKIKTNNKEDIFIVYDRGLWFWFFTNPLFSICFSLTTVWEGCTLTQIPCPVAFGGRLLQHWQRSMTLFPWAQVTFPQIIWFCLVCLQDSLGCSWLYTQKHISSFISGINSFELCALFGSRDFPYSQQKRPCTIMAFCLLEVLFPADPGNLSSKFSSRDRSFFKILF